MIPCVPAEDANAWFVFKQDDDGTVWRLLTPQKMDQKRAELCAKFAAHKHGCNFIGVLPNLRP
jgi:hypothetical protein